MHPISSEFQHLAFQQIRFKGPAMNATIFTMECYFFSAREVGKKENVTNKLAFKNLIQSSKLESAENSPVTPPLTKERLPRTLYRPTGMGMAYSSSDSLDHHPMQARHYCDSNGLTSTPKLSSISGAKTETSSMDASIRSSSSRDADRSGELSISNASDMETEWVEQDEPGVYITIRALPGGKRELRRVRFRYDFCYTVYNQIILGIKENMIHIIAIGID